MFLQSADDNIVRYLSGKITNSRLYERPEWKDMTFTNSDVDQEISRLLAPNHILGYIGVIQGKDVNDNYRDNNVAIYGEYFDENFTICRGFIAICTMEGNLVQLITKYDSGVDIYDITAINVEDNGKITAVEKTVNSQNPNGKMRYLLLDNFLIPDSNNNYKVHIRESRIFPTNILTPKDYIITHFSKNPSQDEVMFITAYNKTTTPRNWQLYQWCSFNKISKSNRSKSRMDVSILYKCWNKRYF